MKRKEFLDQRRALQGTAFEFGGGDASGQLTKIISLLKVFQLLMNFRSGRIEAGRAWLTFAIREMV